MKKFLSFVVGIALLLSVSIGDTASLFPYPKFHGQTTTGAALVGGKLYTYAPGTTTPKASYTTAAMTVPNTNPVILNSSGDAVVYLDGVYDIVFKNSAGVTQWSLSSVTGIDAYKQTYEVDALNDYGGGTSYTQATIAAALTAIGTTNKATLLLRPGTWVISSDADWSAYTNVTFKIAPGAVLSHGAYTVKISYPDSAPVQILSGTGLVTFYGAVGPVYSEWFGSVTGDNTFDNSVPINKAILSVQGYAESNKYPYADKGGAVVQLLTGIYYTRDEITMGESSWLRGMGVNKTGIIQKVAGKKGIDCPAKTGHNTPYVVSRISDLYLSSWDYTTSTSVAASYGIHVNPDGFSVEIERVNIQDWVGDWAIYNQSWETLLADSAVEWGSKAIYNSSTNPSQMRIVNTEVSYNGLGILNSGELYIERCNIHYNNVYNISNVSQRNTSISKSHFEQDSAAPTSATGAKNILIKNSPVVNITENYFNTAADSDPAVSNAEIEIDAADASTDKVNIFGNIFSGHSPYIVKRNGYTATIQYKGNSIDSAATYGKEFDPQSDARVITERGMFIENSVSITAASSAIITLNVPPGATLLGAQLLVDSALEIGDTWDAAYSTGATQAIATNQAVAKNTKVTRMFDPFAATPLSISYCQITITKNGGGSFTAQGTITARTYYLELSEFKL